MAQTVGSSVAAGDSADVTFAPFLGGEETAGTLTVTDGTTTVLDVEEVVFTGGGTVTDAGFGVADVAIATAGYSLLHSITLGSNSIIDFGLAALFPFTIPQTYLDIVVSVDGLLATSAATQYCEINLNNDFGATYVYNFIELNNGAVSYTHSPVTTTGICGRFPGEFSAARAGHLELTICGYSQAYEKPMPCTTSGAYFPGVGSNAGWYTTGHASYSGTGGITRITLQGTSGEQFVAGTRADFYVRGVA